MRERVGQMFVRGLWRDVQPGKDDSRRSGGRAVRGIDIHLAARQLADVGYRARRDERDRFIGETGDIGRAIAPTRGALVGQYVHRDDGEVGRVAAYGFVEGGDRGLARNRLDMDVVALHSVGEFGGHAGRRRVGAVGENDEIARLGCCPSPLCGFGAGPGRRRLGGARHRRAAAAPPGAMPENAMAVVKDRPVVAHHSAAAAHGRRFFGLRGRAFGLRRRLLVC